MSAMVQAAQQFLRRAEPFTVSAEAQADADRPLSPQQIAQGVVSVSTSWRGPAELLVRLDILPGFHINAHKVEGDVPLIATALTLGDDAGAMVEYPPGREMGFAFADKPIRVYDGDVTIVVRFASPRREGAPAKLALSYQACDERACLPPVTKQVEVASG